jgi:uncharacterized protein YidB (DUF937 family)
MGLFEDVSQQLLSGAAGSPHPGMANAVLQMIASHPGGLPALVQSFHDQGLGAAVTSWIGNGQNQPITADQIQKVLSNAQIQQLAQKAGVSPTLAASTLAAVLPGVVDKLTPNGTIEHSLLAGGLNFLSKMS